MLKERFLGLQATLCFCVFHECFCVIMCAVGVMCVCLYCVHLCVSFVFCVSHNYVHVLSLCLRLCHFLFLCVYMSLVYLFVFFLFCSFVSVCVCAICSVSFFY